MSASNLLGAASIATVAAIGPLVLARARSRRSLAAEVASAAEGNVAAAAAAAAPEQEVASPGGSPGRRHTIARFKMAKGDVLDELRSQVPAAPAHATAYHEAMALLRELGNMLQSKADAAGSDLLTRANQLLHQWRRETREAGTAVGGSTRMREAAIAALLKGATSREAVGLRQWIPEGRVSEGPVASAITPKRFKTVARGAVLAQRVIHPAVRLSATEAQLGELLEHGVAQWEFDSVRLTALTGGHPLLALGWALFERHHLRDELGLSSEVVLGFLSQVEAHGQSGRLGEAKAGLHGLIRRQLKAWGCPPHSWGERPSVSDPTDRPWPSIQRPPKPPFSPQMLPRGRDPGATPCPSRHSHRV